MTLAERLTLAMSKAGISQAELARACGVKPPSVHGWLSGKAKFLRGENLLTAAAALGVSQQWLATGKGSMEPGAEQVEWPSNVIALHPEDPLPDGVVQVPEYRVRFSGGNGSTVVEYDLNEEAVPATYRLEWMQRMRLNPKKLMRFKVKGDSMEPLLFAGDSVLVNLAENDIAQLVEGKVYAIRYGSELRVKRLYPKLDGSLILRSDNKDYTDEFVPPDLVHQHITIIGRVRDKSGAGGL